MSSDVVAVFVLRFRDSARDALIGRFVVAWRDSKTSAVLTMLEKTMRVSRGRQRCQTCCAFCYEACTNVNQCGGFWAWIEVFSHLTIRWEQFAQ